MKITYEELEEAVDKLRFKEQRFLKENGWDYTSSTPHARWLWKKEIDGITYCMNKEDAIDLQRYLEDA